jgi:hypothetical protein
VDKGLVVETDLAGIGSLGMDFADTSSILHLFCFEFERGELSPEMVFRVPLGTW